MWLCLALIVVISFAAIFNLFSGPVIVAEIFKHQQSEDLDLSFAYCRNESGARESIDSLSWSSGGLKIEATLTPGCGTTWLFGDYRINEDNELLLGYKSISPYTLACVCPYKVTYEISDIEKRDYTIRFKEYAVISKAPMIYKWIVGDVDDYVSVGEL